MGRVIFTSPKERGDASLTGTMSELEAQVGAAEAVYGDGQFDELSPARTIVVVEDE